MKKIAVILLIHLYMIPAIGISGSVHYCGGKIASISINGIGNFEKCSCGSKKMAGDCCSDEAFSFQFEDEQSKPVNLTPAFDKSVDILTFSITRIPCSILTPLINKGYHPDNISPDLVNIPIYLLHRVIII